MSDAAHGGDGAPFLEVRDVYKSYGDKLVLESAPGPVRARVHEAYASRILMQLMDCLRAGLPEGASVRVGSLVRGEEGSFARRDTDSPSTDASSTQE